MIFADGHEHSIFFKQNNGFIFFMSKRVRLVLSGSWCMFLLAAFIFLLKSFGFTFARLTRPFKRAAIIVLHALCLPARRDAYA